MIQAMPELAPHHCYSLFPSFGDFYFDPLMPSLNPYSGRNVQYGPSHLSHDTARIFRTGLMQRSRWARRMLCMPTTSGAQFSCRPVG